MIKIKFLAFFLITLFSCKPQPKEEPLQQADSATQEIIHQTETQFDYTPIYGVYDHESTTEGFGAVVSIRQEGFNLYFTLSVSQGSCKSETEGVVTMVEHTKNYYTGFYNFDKCPLQFTFYPTQQKVDVKEVSLCTVHSGGCNYEGVYLKRKE